MNTRIALAAGIFAAVAITGCGTASSSSPPPSSAAAAAATSSAAGLRTPPAIPTPSVTSVACTTQECIVADVTQLVGVTTGTGSVITAMSCDQSTVKRAAPGIWTVDCTTMYTDGTQGDGIATVLLSQNKATWKPTD
jgi:hypothetical protein